jgi:hypothetical protein
MTLHPWVGLRRGCGMKRPSWSLDEEDYQKDIWREDRHCDETTWPSCWYVSHGEHSVGRERSSLSKKGVEIELNSTGLLTPLRKGEL